MTITRQEAIAQYGEPDKMGHVTRFSDSSLHDEICVLCGLVDGVGYTPQKNIYNTRCYVEADEPPVVEVEVEKVSMDALEAYVSWDPPGQLDVTNTARALGLVRAAFFAGWSAAKSHGNQS